MTSSPQEETTYLKRYCFRSLSAVATRSCRLSKMINNSRSKLLKCANLPPRGQSVQLQVRGDESSGELCVSSCSCPTATGGREGRAEVFQSTKVASQDFFNLLDVTRNVVDFFTVFVGNHIPLKRENKTS